MSLTRRELLEAAGAGVVASAMPAGAFARRPDGPNVLLIVVDTLRADHVGAYGGRARTPTFDALARDGLRFTRFYPEAMATVPARRSILGGRRVFPFRGWHPYEREGLRDTPGWAPIDDVPDTLTSTLRRAGWWTAYATDNPFLGFADGYARFRSSFDRFARVAGQIGTARPTVKVSRRELDSWLIPELREEEHIERRVREFLASGQRYWEDESRSWAARVSMAGVSLLDEAAAHRPFALVVDTYEPHEPWTPPRSYVDMYGDPDHRGPEPCMSRYDRVKDWLPPDRREPVITRMRDLYAAELTMTDRWLGIVLDKLHALGLENETVVALVADHGYLIGEYGWTGKVASVLHPPLIHVPFILVHPARLRAGESTSWLAQTHDVAPTLLDIANVGRAKPMNGVSVAPLLAGLKPRVGRTTAYGGYANWHYARTDRWSYVAANTGRRRRLYDLKQDPGERNNIARRHPHLVDDLEERVRHLAGGPLPSYDGRGRLRRR